MGSRCVFLYLYFPKFGASPRLRLHGDTDDWLFTTPVTHGQRSRMGMDDYDDHDDQFLFRLVSTFGWEDANALCHRLLIAVETAADACRRDDDANANEQANVALADKFTYDEYHVGMSSNSDPNENIIIPYDDWNQYDYGNDDDRIQRRRRRRRRRH